MPSTGEPNNDKRAEWLRTKAIERLQQQDFSRGGVSPFSAEGIEELIEELRIHQAELEQQAEELNASQAALVASRDAYYALFDLAPVPHLILTTSGVVTGANLAAVNAFHYDRKLLLNRSAYLLFNEAGASQFHAALESASSGAAPPPFEAPVVRSDGAEFRARVFLVPFSGQVEHGDCLMTLVDMAPVAPPAARKAHALEDAKDAGKGSGEDVEPHALFQAHCLDLLVHGLSASAWTTDRRLTLTYCLGSLFGEGGPWQTGIEGRPLMQTVEGMTAGETLLAMHRKALNDGAPVVFDMQCPDRVFEVRVAPVYDSEGRVSGLAGIALDRPPQEHTGQAAPQQQRMLASLMDSMRDATALCDRDLVVRYANQALLNRISMPRERVVGHALDEVLAARPDLAALWRSRAERALATGSLRVYQDSKMLLNPGDFAETAVFPVRGKAGQFEGVGTVIRDVTQSRQHERKMQEAISAAEQARTMLEKANEELQAANQHKSRFIASMSHELRTPLNAIMGFTDLLMREAKGPLNESQKGYVEQCRRSGEHLLALIMDLLDIARVDTGRLSLDLQHCSPEDFVEGAVQMVREKASRRGIRIDVETPEPRLPLYCDARRCRQVVLNILGNAVKFSSEGARVLVTVQRQGEDRVEVRVRDWGEGIAPAEQARIFTEFYQVEKSHRDQAGGAGIGLALSRRLIELHSGEIGVDSAEGEGSTFWFTLPIDTKAARPVAAPETRGQTPPEVSPMKKYRVLVAEDNEVNLMLITEFLKEAGHHIAVARNGQEAIELTRESLPDVILMDLHMPVVDGPEAMRRIGELHGEATPPMIALSASSDAASVERSISAGAMTHLAKPFTPEELFDAMDRSLNLNRKD